MEMSLPESPPRPRLSLAVATNLLPPVAWGYELWRARALTLLSGRRFPLEEEFAQLVAALEPVRGGVFADLGTSTGLYARALLCRGAARVYAVDLSSAMLRVAVRKARGLPGFVPMRAWAESLPLPPQSCDGVAVGGSWNEFPQPERVAAEMARVLKPGGRYFVMFAHAGQSPLQRLLELSGLRFSSSAEVQAILEKFGLRGRAWREGGVGFVSGAKVVEAV
ncbi:class I SAM-dependent methyltransferase [Meiothermus sp. PNK-Is4]|nr:class I SAM-dependent methyltransferase [Meiothermus sp. Pnk-1]RYM40872.1 class I SAM-dependent methyltransferase [Meiothermus sp. PNK-Is4]